MRIATKLSTPTSYYNKHRRNFLIKEHQFKLKELNRLARKKLIKQPVMNIIDEEDIQFCDNDNDSDINFLDENYQSKIVDPTPPKYDLNMLANRSDIIESFIMKEGDDDDIICENSNDNQFFDEPNGENQFWPSINQSESSNKINNKSRIRKFSDKIRDELERKFLQNNFISGNEKTYLAKSLNLTERQVQKWFVHRREKLRRLEKKATLLNSTLQQQKQQAYQIPVKNLNPPITTVIATNSFNRQQRKVSTENPYQKVYLTRPGNSTKHHNNTMKQSDYNSNNKDEHLRNKNTDYSNEHDSDIEIYEENNNDNNWTVNSDEIELQNENFNVQENHGQFAIVNDDENDYYQEENEFFDDG